MRLLVTNDDGIPSSFLHLLCQKLASQHQVTCVVPKTEQSGVGQAISMFQGLKVIKHTEFSYPTFSVSGTPSDCLKFAFCHLYHPTSFDLVISGINPGENAGLSALYSGTVAGAREAASWEVPSIALSVWNSEMWRAEAASDWILRLLEQPEVLPQKNVFWNVNFPFCPTHQIKGVKVCTMSLAMFSDKYIPIHTPRNTTEYWLDGIKNIQQFHPDSDDHFLKEGYITVAPLQVNQTNLAEITRLNHHQFPQPISH